MTTHYLTTPLTDAVINTLVVGDEVNLSGVIYMARDAAHKRFVELIQQGQPLPIDLTGQVVFYGGPCPTKPGMYLGSLHRPLPIEWILMRRCCLIMG